MRNRLLPAAIILVILAASLSAKRLLGTAAPDDPPQPRRRQRIVSMAPSITETLYALGLDDRVAGRTRYCLYPPEVKSKPEVGGYLNPNYEAVLAVKPDLVIALTGDPHAMAAFHKLRLRTLVVCHNDVEGVLASFTDVGRLCGAEDRAGRIVADIRARMQRIRRKTARLDRPRVLIVIQRAVVGGKLEDICVAGGESFPGRMIALAGGRNACPPTAVRAPVVSAEGIMSINPQVILDMTAGLSGEKQDPEELLSAWRQLGPVEAVRHGRVRSLDADYAFVPGPRFILLLEELARLIHPEVDWRP